MSATTPTPASTSRSEWTPQSWRAFPVGQPVTYPELPAATDEPAPDPRVWKRKETLEEVTERLEQLPPLVSAVEIEKLRKQLADVAKGKAFLLQGGDCAELFSYCSAARIEDRLSLLLSMSLILIWGMKQPVVRIARMGGQYAKPRSSPTETLPDGSAIPSFRGENVNGLAPDDRLPDPSRLLSAYFHSSATLNHVRSLLSSGFASLPSAKGDEGASWSLPLEHVRSKELLEEYEQIVRSLGEALEFLGVVGVERGAGGGLGGALESADVWMSHEALMLEYEAALTRKMPIPAFAKQAGGDSHGWYCTSAHFIWIGDRTRDINGAHVEFFRGLRNPIGIKVGPSMDPAELTRLLAIVDPSCSPGRVTLITRYGAAKITTHLPLHLAAVNASPHRDSVIWQSDPMHGNTKSVRVGGKEVKTRMMADVLGELAEAVRIHKELGVRPLGGAHLELTAEGWREGRTVTECVGGSMELGEEALGDRFESYCDPRLNFEQSLDVAFMLSHQFQATRRGRTGTNRILDELRLPPSRPQSTNR